MNDNVMDHTTPNALGCDALEVQSVVYPSDFAFLSHCSPVSLEAQLGLLDCERYRAMVAFQKCDVGVL